MLTLHTIRIELNKSDRVTLDLLLEMPRVLVKIGLTQLSHYTAFRDWFEAIPIGTWRAFFDALVGKRTGHTAVNATDFDRDQPSRHYATCLHYRVRALKLTALVDVETLYITDIHSTTSKKSDFLIGSQIARWNTGDLLSLAADKGYDKKAFRDQLREAGTRPLIKHRRFTLLNYAHNVRMDSDRYTSAKWLRPYSPASSAHSTLLCVRAAGISNFGR